MRKLVFAFIVVLALGAAAPAAADTVIVRILRNSGFTPSSVTIKIGDTVRWLNKTTQNHQIVSDRGLFVSKIIPPRQSYSFRFRSAGHFHYHDGLRRSMKGVVNVPGPPPAVTIGVSLPIATFGTQVTLSGAISSKKEGRPVTVLQRPFGQSSFTELDTLTTGTDGAWSFSTTPTILTEYRARYQNAVSDTASVAIRPKVTLRYARPFLSTRVTSAISYFHHFVYLQRLTRFGTWVKVRKLFLGRRSGRVFKPPRRRRVRTYRIFLPASQAGAGYLPAISGTQRVRRR